VSPASDGVPRPSHQDENQPHDQQDDTDGPKDGNSGDETDRHQDDADQNHSFASQFGPAILCG
jgi:hypothetical protein